MRYIKIKKEERLLHTFWIQLLYEPLSEWSWRLAALQPWRHRSRTQRATRHVIDLSPFFSMQKRAPTNSLKHRRTEAIILNQV